MSKLEKILKDRSPLAQEIITGIAELLELETPQTEVTPQQIISKLKSLNGVNFHTYESGSFNELTRTISRINPPVTEKDLDLLYNWLNDSGLTWWRARNITVTWKHICKYFVDWLTRAREYEYQEISTESVIR